MGMPMDLHARRLKLMLLTVGLGVGGTEGQVSELALHLDRRRFDVVVCAFKKNGVIANELRNRGIRVITLNGHGLWDVRVILRFVRIVGQEGPDIIHAFLFLANIASRFVGRLLHVPILISSYRGVEIWQSPLLRFLDRLTVRLADINTCCSEAIRYHVMSQHRATAKERYAAIHNGINIRRFSNSIPLTRAEMGIQEKVTVIGTVCRLEEPVKGLTVLLKAVAQLNVGLADPGAQLLVVGDGPALGELQGLSVQLGISERVFFTGMRRDIERLLPLMDIFVLPSYFEGFGIAIVEAMAAGRPVVATAVGGVPEIVINEETGLLVEAGDVNGLAKAIETLIYDPDLRRRLGQRGQERAREQFSIELAVRRHEELYEASWRRALARGRKHWRNG